jgi:hypothetical protein
VTAGRPDGEDRARAAELHILEADARYARERAALYRARVWGGKRATSTGRLRDLEFAERATSERLQHARRKKA